MANWYYYNKNGEKVGPISVSDLKTLVLQGLITRDTVIEDHTGRSAKAGDVNGLTFPEAAQTPLRVPVPAVAQPAVHINAKDSFGWTPLYRAVLRKDTKTVADLINAGADPFVQNDRSASPKHYVVSGDTPIRCAVNTKSDELVEMLLSTRGGSWNVWNVAHLYDLLRSAKYNNNSPRVHAALAKRLEIEKEPLRQYAAKLEKRSGLMGDYTLGCAYLILWCGICLIVLGALAGLFGDDIAAGLGMLGIVVGVPMLIPGGILGAIGFFKNQELQNLNNELRPIFGEDMELNACVVCGGACFSSPSACKKRGYVIVTGETRAFTGTFKEEYTPQQTLRDTNGQIIGTIEGEREFRDVRRTVNSTPYMCLNCGASFKYYT